MNQGLGHIHEKNIAQDYTLKSFSDQKPEQHAWKEIRITFFSKTITSANGFTENFQHNVV